MVAPRPGFLAPDFKAPKLEQKKEGREITLSDYRGKIVLINFWATWCAPCKAEMPAMEELYRSFPRKDFEILGVSIDLVGPGLVAKYVRDLGVTFPILLDPQMAINDLYEVRVVPTSVLIDREGRVTHRHLGARDWNDRESRKLIAQLVSAGPPASS